MEKLPELKIIGNNTLIPIDEKISFTGIGFLFEDEIETCANLFNFLAQATQNNCDFGFVDLNINSEDLLTLKSGIEQSDIFIFVMLPSNKEFYGKDSHEKIQQIIRELSSYKPIILILNNNSAGFSSLNPDLCFILPDSSFPSLASCIISISGRSLENN